MRRVINKNTMESQNTGGVKMGDFGTGGRTYKTDAYRKGGSGEDGGGAWCVGILLLLAGLGGAYWNEHGLHLKLGIVAEVAQDAVSLYHPKADPSLEGRLLHVNSEALELTGDKIVDHFFGIEFLSPKAARKTEYCQWMEVEHRKQVIVGKDPDFCTSTRGQTQPEAQCGSVNCRSKRLNQCPAPCCMVQRGADIVRDEISYTYHKGWRSGLVNSMMFDNPGAYHNPSYDPAPSKTFFAQGDVELASGSGPDGLRVLPLDIEATLQAAEPVYLSRDFVYALPEHALYAGFGEADHLYFYSRGDTDGWSNPMVRAAASYLVDGVIDVTQISKATGVESMLDGAGLGWITKGTCNAGDIRTSFYTHRLPQDLTVVGRQSGNRVVKHAFANGEVSLLARAGRLGLDELLDAEVSDATWWARLYRVLLALPCLGCGFGLGLTLYGLMLAGLWNMYYGSAWALYPLGVAGLGLVAWLGGKSNSKSKQ